MHPAVLSKERILVLHLQDPVSLNNKAKWPEFIAQTDVMSGSRTPLLLSRKGMRLLFAYNALYEGWNFNFGNTPLDWIKELLE